MKKIIIAGLMLALAGCAAAPTQLEIANADYGTYPDNYQEIIKGYMSATLKDPYSAQYSFLNEPKQGYGRLGGLKWGWVVCATVNAKNSFGGYVGQRLNYFMIKNGRVADATLGDGSYGDAMAQGKCKAFTGG